MLHLTAKNPDIGRSFTANLAFIQQRIDCLDQHRHAQALRNHSANFQQVYRLLPTLIHYNHPDLPGYVAKAPAGIALFEPDAQQAVDLSRFFANSTLPASPATHAFDGLYAMGSIGSVTQTAASDLDLWLCHSQTFSSVQIQLIEQKLAHISQWAASLGVEIHFYLMNPQAFKQQRYHSVNDDHNGSAQHFCLLDEFYRSVVRLAGKRILWLHIDHGKQPYESFIKRLEEKGELDISQWVDFGDFASLPIEEYFGASLWQLYKGTRKPYKSAIKILLLESYAQTYPQTPWIAKQFKQQLLNPSQVRYHFDPYLAMLEQVTNYLTHRKEFARLDRLRHCFYIKSIDNQHDSERLATLEALVAQWGWSHQQVAQLNNHKHWKIKQIAKQQQMIVEMLLQSYRNLIQFARKFHLDPSILPQDTDILMRKLYSVFEAVPGKVSLINENLTAGLSETDVTFVHVAEGKAVKAGWYLLNHAPKEVSPSHQRHIQHQKSLVELVAWGYFNRIITAQTRLYTVGESLSQQKLRQFMTDLRLSLPALPPDAASRGASSRNEICSLMVAINLTCDPSKQLLSEIAEKIGAMYLLSPDQKLVGSMSIIYRNRWNEVLTQHFEGQDAFRNALKFLSNKVYRRDSVRQSVNVFCYSAQFRNVLQAQVKHLVQRCITVETGKIVQPRRDPFNVSVKKWQNIFSQSTTPFDTLANSIVAYHSAKKAPSAIYNFASEEFLQFFFEDNRNGSFNVYILDKKNELESYFGCSGSKEEKIKLVTRLYLEQAFVGLNDNVGSFNFPQFYQLLSDHGKTLIVPFQSQQHRQFSAQN